MFSSSLASCAAAFWTSILAALGIPVSNAINMFYKQIILQRGIPFEMKLPQARVVDMGKLTAQELDQELDACLTDADTRSLLRSDRSTSSTLTSTRCPDW